MAETPRDQCYCGQCDGHHGHPDGPATAPAAPSVGEPEPPVRIRGFEAFHPDYGLIQWDTADLGVGEPEPDNIAKWLARPVEEQTLPWSPLAAEEFDAIDFDSQRFDDGCDRDMLIRLTYTIHALRSSLEEARKDSERWQWARERFKLVAMPADEFCPRPAAYLDAPDLMEFTMCDGTFETVDAIVDRARAAALARHLPPRAPSPRDEP